MSVHASNTQVALDSAIFVFVGSTLKIETIDIAQIVDSPITIYVHDMIKNQAIPSNYTF